MFPLVIETAENNQRYASIVTKTVQAVARNQFDCQPISGGQLENQPTGTGLCTGDTGTRECTIPKLLAV